MPSSPIKEEYNNDSNNYNYETKMKKNFFYEPKNNAKYGPIKKYYPVEIRNPNPNVLIPIVDETFSTNLNTFKTVASNKRENYQNAQNQNNYFAQRNLQQSYRNNLNYPNINFLENNSKIYKNLRAPKAAPDFLRNYKNDLFNSFSDYYFKN